MLLLSQSTSLHAVCAWLLWHGLRCSGAGGLKSHPVEEDSRGFRAWRSRSSSFGERSGLWNGGGKSEGCFCSSPCTCTIELGEAWGGIPVSLFCLDTVFRKQSQILGTVLPPKQFCATPHSSKPSFRAPCQRAGNKGKIVVHATARQMTNME